MERQQSYKAALYLRVSKEDKENRVQKKSSFSSSIENQKQFLFDYLQRMPDVTIYDIYIDDGYSGLIFEERPGFLRMWKDIINHTVNMVVVKDLSRFGREHIQTDAYIQKIFPSLGVRFLSVTDSYDSLLAKEGERHLLIPVKNFINDCYAQDISIKIRSSQEAMRKEGICVAAYVPYGYQKKQGKLFPDAESSLVVKLIYLMKLEGESVGGIAKKLHLWGIPSPTEFRKERGSAYYSGFQMQKIAKWSGGSVDRILKDRVYTGTLEQGKRMRISYKVRHVVSVSKEKWSVVKKSHSAIIAEDEYELVQQISLLDIRRAPERKKMYLLSGFLFCADCKRGMTRRTGRSLNQRRNYFLCSGYNKGEACTRHTIAEEVICQMVWQMIEWYCHPLKAVLEKMYQEYWKKKEGETSIWDIFIQKNQKRLQRYQERLKQVETDFYKGELDPLEYDRYRKTYQQEQQRMKEAILFCKWEKMHREKAGIWGNPTEERLLLVWLIRRIEVSEEKKVTIWFRFQMDI